ncbi:MarR family winged helix-turn-helix transcriptional regulator [Azospirillum sp. ST 5-10]|uniref:MarR family winged helix-turn-helix transcriptional regulator n=1 Tax=unclassified Azospirillum TaxID=2630922 RepID=UPI003F4A52FB
MLSDFVGFHLRLAQETSYQAFLQRILADEELEGLKLKPGHLTFFALLAENPGITQTALSRASGRDKSSLTPVVEDFARRGFVEKRRLPNDRRSYALSLTPRGEALHRRLAAHAAAHEAELDRVVGIENKADLIGALRRIKMSLG